MFIIFIYIEFFRYNPNSSYEPNEGRYTELVSARDLYLQNIIVSEHDNHSDSFEVKFLNILRII